MSQVQEEPLGPLATSLREFRLQQEAATAKQASTSGALPPQDVQLDVEGDSSILSTVKDTLFGLASGPAKAADEVLDLSWGVGNYVREGVQKGFDNARFREPSDAEKSSLPRFHSIEPDTQAGKMAQSISQFVAGFVTTGTTLKAAKVLQVGAIRGGLVRPAIQGAVTDFATFDAHADRLSNIVEQYPSLRGPISAYLAADTNDSMLEGRLKNMLEGLALGVATDSMVQGVKSLKGLFNAASPDEAIKALDAAQAPSIIVQPESIAIAPQKGTRKKPTPVIAPEPPLPSQVIKEMVDKAADATEAINEVAYNINLNKMVFESPQGSNVLIQMNDALADKTLKAAGPEQYGVILRDSLQDLQEHGIDYTPVLAEAGADPKAVHAITRRALSNRNILHTLTTESSRLSAIINEGRASLVEQARFVMLSKNIQEMHLSLADMRTELGRALSSLNIKADGKMVTEVAGDGEAFLSKWFGSDGLTNDAAAKWLEREGWTPANLKQLANDVQLMDGNSAAINNALKNSKGGSLWGIATEVRINGLLSGPQTWAANGLGNALKTLVMPTEKIIGGILTKDTNAIRAGTQTYVGLFKYLTESWNMMGKAFKVGENILDAKNGIMEAPSHQMTYDNIRSLILKKNPEGELSAIQEILARSLGSFGTVLRLPTKIMVATDELFKQLNFRAAMYSKLYGEAVDKAGLKDSQEIADYIETNMRKAFTPEGAVAKGDMTDDALMTAQRSTWTQALDEGTLGNVVQTAAAKHPLVRLVVPFIKTPTNLIRDFGQHTLAAPLYKEVREAYAKGGEERARVVGQVAMGQLTAVTGIALAYSGSITGSPPKDPKLRKALEATGWEPYSLKIGDRYVSYRRLDPVGMFLGQAADVVAVMTGKDDLTELEQNEVVMGLLVTTVNNITSKTYMQGIAETINALHNPERYGKAYIGRMASTFIPASSMLRTIRKETDPHMREMEDIPDYIKNTIPGLSDDLPARRHWVTGEIIDYRLIGQDKHNMVLDELQRLGRAVTGAPLKTLHGVKLTTQQYSALNELHGTVKIQGKTLSQALGTLFSSSGYDIHRAKKGDAPDGMESPRSRTVDKVIHAYRKQAENALLRSDPDLLQEANVKYRENKLAAKGAVTKENHKSALQQLSAF